MFTNKPQQYIATQRGFTLFEVLVALAIAGIIAVLASQALNTATSGAAASEDAMERLALIDKTFVLIENDIRNAVIKTNLKDEFGSAIKMIEVSESEEHFMTLMRGGYSNPLHQMRTEEVRIGYRLVDDVIWRDTWYNYRHTDLDDARQLKLVDQVVNLEVLVLPETASSVAAGPWLNRWPDNGAPLDKLPLAMRIRVELEDMGELERLFTFLPGTGDKIQASSSSSSGGGGSSSGNPGGGER